MRFQDPLGIRFVRDGGEMDEGHLPVLVDEVIEILAPAPGSLHIDATLGGGGHTERILEAASPDGRLLGLDADPAAIARVDARLRPRFGDRLVLRQANFRDLAEVAPDAGFDAVDGCLFDLGLSSFQLADRERGFGFRAGGPLDMRFDPSRGVPAAELLASLDAAELTALFRRYGEEPKAPRIARAIVDARRVAPISTAEELAALVERVLPPNPRVRRRTHPATRVFQAMRIAVNEELEALQAGLAAALDLLRPGGRLVVLSYHSLEDRIVKRFFQAERRGCVCPPELPVCVCGRNPRLRLVTSPSLTPSATELAANPRARSARLRAAERLAA
jgi:16S rRNA (cytosine1402-N4)-methyltransferase